MEYVVDVQCFQSGEIYFIKELAITNLSKTDTPQVFLFDSPFSWNELSRQDKITNRGLERNHHGIPWNLRGLPQSEVAFILFKYLPHAATVYVKGQNKVEWLQIYIPYV